VDAGPERLPGSGGRDDHRDRGRLTPTEHPDPTARIAVGQVRISIEDVGANRAAVAEVVGRAAKLGADLVVLPELVTSGYVFTDAAEARGHAESSTGPTVSLFAELSAEHQIMIIGGWCERADSDRLYNSAAVLDRGELLANYRKTHLWDREKLIFTPGEEAPPVINTRLGLVGVMVCYDLEFPELVGEVARRGAQLIAAPSNWPAGVPVPVGERPVEVIKAQAAAAVNRIAVAVADRCGPERDVPWIGASVICGMDGYLLAGPATGEPALLWADVDLAAARDKRLGPHNDALGDRRPELYH
jgi:predicted amidohydrolase